MLRRVLATVLFTDIVDSTARAAELGDAAWRAMVERHHAVVRPIIGRYGGTEVDTAGDGFFATFDGPGRGVRAAQAIVSAVPAVGLAVRAGVHTGECELIDGKPGGLAINIGARIGALARPSEVLVSRHGEEPGGRLRHGLRRSGQPSAQGRSRRVANLGRTLLSLAARDAKVCRSIQD